MFFDEAMIHFIYCQFVANGLMSQGQMTDPQSDLCQIFYACFVCNIMACKYQSSSQQVCLFLLLLEIVRVAI